MCLSLDCSKAMIIKLNPVFVRIMCSCGPGAHDGGFICSVILGQLESSRNYNRFSIIFLKILAAI